MKAPNLIALTLLLSSGLMAQDSAPATKAKGKAAPVAPATPASALDNMMTMIPEGLRNLKVRIPGFEQGRASSLVIADAMTRQGASNLFAEGLTIHIYAENPKENLRVDMKSATYHMDTKMLTSDERSKVSRADFQIEGDSMTFDTTTSQGSMKGHVHMVIFDTAGFMPKQEEAVPKAIPVPQPSSASSAGEAKKSPLPAK